MMILNVKDFIGKRILIVGDVGSGKTILTLNIINKFLEYGFGEEISILDFAPNSINLSNKKVGGKLIEFSFNPNMVKNYFPVYTYPPRILGKCRSEVLNYAKFNRVNCGNALQRFINDPTNILIINDISLYYHIGDLGLIIDVLKLCKTFIANAYFNGFIEDKFSSGISVNERLMTENLMRIVDFVINLNVQFPRIM